MAPASRPRRLATGLRSGKDRTKTLARRLPSVTKASGALQAALCFGNRTTYKLPAPSPAYDLFQGLSTLAILDDHARRSSSTRLDLSAISFHDVTPSLQTNLVNHQALANMVSDGQGGRRLAVFEVDVPNKLEKNAVVRWIYFKLSLCTILPRTSDASPSSWICIAMPHSAVKKVAEFKELVMMSSGVTMEFMKVELRCSQGGVPIFEFGGEGNDTVDNFDKMAVWEDIKSAMGRGHCRIRYLYKRKQWGEKPNPQAA